LSFQQSESLPNVNFSRLPFLYKKIIYPITENREKLRFLSFSFRISFLVHVFTMFAKGWGCETFGDFEAISYHVTTTFDTS